MKKGFFMLVRAGIRQRKKLFIGEFAIMLIVICVVSSCLSCRFGIERGVEEADALDVQFDEYWIIDTEEIPSDGIAELQADPLVGNITLRTGLVMKNDGSYLILAQRASDTTVFMKDDCSGAADERPEIKQGTVYIAQGFNNYSIGDTITLTLRDSDSSDYNWHTFTVGGYILDTALGSFGMGTKNVVISDEDMALLEEEAKERRTAASEKDEDLWLYFTTIFAEQAAGSDLSDNEFGERINETHPFLKTSLFCNSRSDSDYFITLVVEIITDVMLVLSAIMFLILLIISAHNISSGIRLDYTDIGIIRANGAGHLLPLGVICAEHMLVILCGAAAGLPLSVPLTNVMSGPFQIFTAVPASPYIVWKLMIPAVAAVLLFSAGVILLSGRKITAVSPLSAINGGMQDVYFQGTAHTGISGRMLNFTLAIRQLRSGIIHYAGIAVIAFLLSFLVLLTCTLNTSFGSRRAMESMGILFADFGFDFPDGSDTGELAEKADAAVAEYTDFVRFSYSNIYGYVNGSNCRWDLFSDNYEILVHKGRAPAHENEIAMTEILAENLGVKIGDEVSISYGENTCVCTITGYSQTINDLGKGIAINYRTAANFGFTTPSYVYYTLEDDTHKTEAYNKALEALGDDVKDSYIEEDDENSVLGDYQVIVDIVDIVLYVACILICFVSVSMNCTKLLVIEKRDLGIYRSMGFSVNGLRLQFAFRFMLASSVGTIFGVAANFLFSDKLLSLLLKSIGFAYFISEYDFIAILVPLLLVWAFFFAFAFLESRKIRKIEIRSLVSE